MDAAKLKGMAIVSLGEGTKLGRVGDVLFDTQPLRATALRATGEGQTFVIPYAQIASIGADAVTVASGQVTQTASKEGAFGGLPGLGALTRLKVVDEAGTLVGVVGGIALDPPTGLVTGLAVHKGGLLGLGGTTTTLDPATIRGVGDDLLTVAMGGAASAGAERLPATLPDQHEARWHDDGGAPAADADRDAGEPGR